MLKVLLLLLLNGSKYHPEYIFKAVRIFWILHLDTSLLNSNSTPIMWIPWWCCARAVQWKIIKKLRIQQKVYLLKDDLPDLNSWAQKGWAQWDLSHLSILQQNCINNTYETSTSTSTPNTRNWNMMIRCHQSAVSFLFEGRDEDNPKHRTAHSLLEFSDH